MVREAVMASAQLRDAGVDWQMNIYGNTLHSFTNPTAANAKRPDAVRYSRRSWKAMQNHFGATLRKAPD
jgi:hypothetical protein